jgi:hypothetical protein
LGCTDYNFLSMPYKFNALNGTLDLVSADTAGYGKIAEYTTDPTSPTANDVWVLRTDAGHTVTGGGKLRAFMGLGFPYISAGVSSGGGSASYQLSYRTQANTTVRAILS